MAGLLYIAAHGPDDPTRACIPFHLAANGAAESGIDATVNLMAKMLEQGIRVYI